MDKPSNDRSQPSDNGIPLKVFDRLQRQAATQTRIDDITQEDAFTAMVNGYASREAGYEKHAERALAELEANRGVMAK